MYFSLPYSIFIIMIYYIYTLEHPLTNQVRYVGKTTNIKRRYKQHLYDKRSTYKGCWVKSLRSEGLKPIIKVIEECTEANWQEREKYWITQFNDLTNHLEGGNTNYVRTTKEETRQKLSLAHKGKLKSETHKDNIRKSTKKRQCIINGVKYESTVHASKELNIHSATIWMRCNDSRDNGYQFIN